MTLSIIVFNFLNMSKNKYNCFVLWIYVYFFALVLAKLSIQVRYSSMLYNNLILHCWRSMHEALIRIESCMHMVVQNKHDVSTNTKQLYFEHAIMQTMHDKCPFYRTCYMYLWHVWEFFESSFFIKPNTLDLTIFKTV